MLMLKKEAAARTTAKNNIQLNETYQNSNATSIAKLEIGSILLTLHIEPEKQKQSQCWKLFEAKLSRHIDNHFCGGVV